MTEDDIILFLLGAVGVITVIYLFHFFLWKKKERQCKNWSETTGEIISTKVHRTQLGTSGDEDLLSWMKYAYLEVQYKYTVDNKEYIGSRISYQKQVYIDPDEATLKYIQYAPEKKCKVYYNPLKPDEAILDKKTGLNKDVIIMIVIFLLFFGFFGGLMLILYLTENKF